MAVIKKYEYDTLVVGNKGFKDRHLRAFIKLNSLHNNRYFDIIPNGIKFKEYVGIIQVDGLSVEIHPKADRESKKNQWKNVLLSMLQACNRLLPKSAGAANVNKRNLNLLEIYFELFITEIETLLHQGLIKKYRKETKNVFALKGKLEFAGNIRKNSIHKERFYTTHQVYDKNHTIHQILAVALEIVSKINKSSYLACKIAIARFSFPEVKKIKVTAKTFDKIHFSRKEKPYTYALELARLIILNYSPDISTGGKKMLSLLFNMNDLWEEYVLVMLRKYLLKINSDWQITGQESKLFIQGHSLRPDIVLRNVNTKQTIIIDTKWKLGNKYISVQDLRQVYTYGRYWKAEKVMLLYPGNTRTTFKTFVNKLDNPQINCKTAFVSVVDEDRTLDKNIGKKVFNLLEIDD